MDIRILINEDGTPFDPEELEKISSQLDQLQDKERGEYRDKNRKTISENSSDKILIVSGPGTGKTLLFLDRIKYWFQDHPDTKIFVTSFVRKLVEDLHNAIENDEILSNDQKKRVTASTLHGFARSVVEKNHGTSEWSFQPYFNIIGGQIGKKSWEEIIWEDVLAYHPDLNYNDYKLRDFKEQLYNNNLNQSDQWEQLKQTYFELCQFYNASGFADLIIRARIALEENSELNENNFFIIDEYQDFNLAEDALISQLVKNSEGLLIVGDDDQVLYERLKCGKAELTRGKYKNKRMAKAMLPFCSRSNYHITKCIEHFIQSCNDPERIEKIFLPVELNQNVPKVQIVACAFPVTAVNYIEKFIINHKDEIDERKTKLESGEEKDAFLLILTPSKGIPFYDKDAQKINQLITDYIVETREFSEDFCKILDYCSLARNPKDNFLFRKILYYEGYSYEHVHELVDQATISKIAFCNITDVIVEDTLSKCNNIKNIFDDSETSIDEKINNFSKLMSIRNMVFLKKDLEHLEMIKDKDELSRIKELDIDIKEIKRMNAIEVMTIVSSKGLSADHVMIIGFDDINFNYITSNAFYVAMARSRKSLHIITALKSRGSTKAHNFLNQLPEIHLEFLKYTKSRGSEYLENKDCFEKYLTFIQARSRGK